MSSQATRYTATLDLRNINDSHVLALGRVPAGSRVLDLGAADGTVAAVLRQMGCRVWGVEIDPAAAAVARTVCEEVVVEDLNQLDFGACFQERRFDVVLMLDVLEHLNDPAAVLARVGTVLTDRGWGVISVPNVTHASVRLGLLGGNFTYTDVGLLDRTHVRFFDRAGVEGLLRDSGWGMFDMVRVLAPFGTTEIRVEDPDPALVRQLDSDLEALTYQFVLGVAPLGSIVLEQPPVLPAAVAQAAYLELREEVRRLRAGVLPALPEQAGAQQVDLIGHLVAMRQASRDRRTHIRELLATVEAEMERLQATLVELP
jgi:2-polyprenyl-3-methyl-5-hydroxy-6-metoxy-1,4-benzoquinol methylase